MSGAPGTTEVFARATEIMAERFPSGTTDLRELENAVRDAIGELMLGGFHINQRVFHSSRGLGVVKAIRDGALHVEFEDYPGGVSGVFDAGWFQHSGATLIDAKSERTGA